MTDSAPTRWRHLTIRAVGIAAVVVAVLLCLSEWWTGFWSEHQMLGAFVSGLILFAIGSALVNEYLAARSRRRWRTVAALALREFQASCHRIEQSVNGVLNEASTGHVRHSAAELSGIRDSASEVISDAQRRLALKQAIDDQLQSARPTVIAWAPVMIGESHYVGYLEQFVGVLGRAWRISRGLDTPGVSDEAIVAELMDWMLSVARLEVVLSTEVEKLVPWPTAFGDPPGRE